MLSTITIRRSGIERLTETNQTAVIHFIRTLGQFYEAIRNRDRRRDEKQAGVITSFKDVETDYEEEVIDLIRKMRSQLCTLNQKARKHHVQLLNRRIFDLYGRCTIKLQEIEQAGLQLIDDFDAFEFVTT